MTAFSWNARLQRPLLVASWRERLSKLEAPRPEKMGHYARNVVRIGLVMRLVALAAALVGVMSTDVTLGVLGAIVLVSLTSFSVLFLPGAGALLVRHPMLVVADSILAFTILALLGPGSPVGLATVLTALILGAFFDRTMAVTFGVLLLALYVLALAVNAEDEHSFMTLLGLPVIYVCFLVVGLCARSADNVQKRLNKQIATEREARAGADERARLARELHDSVGKSLYGIAMLASGASRSLSSADEATKDELSLIADSAREAAEDARRLIHLQRADSADQPLEHSLAKLCQQWSERRGVPCDFTWAGSGTMDPAVRHETVAITMEALENTARHADATRVTITHEGDETASVLTIADDGNGFDARMRDGLPVEPAGHYGLVGMVERAQRCGASLDIASAPGRGTRITLTVEGGGT